MEPQIPLWVKLGYTLFVAVLVPIYLRHYGPANFLWFSDVALLATVPGLWAESSLILSAMTVAVGLPEILWNVDFGETEPPMPEAVEAALDQAFAQGGAPGLAKVLSGFWRKPIESAPFEPLQELEIERTIDSDTERWVANILSVSSIASQSDEDRAALATRLRELLPQSEYRWRVRTAVYWTRLDG